MRLHRSGGHAAIASVVVWLVCLIGGALNTGTADPGQLSARMMAALSENPTRSTLLLMFYCAGFVFAVVMFLALRERLPGAVLLAQMMVTAVSCSTTVALTGTIVHLTGGGLIVVPAQDSTAFRALWATIFSLRMMAHHAHGWALLMAGCAIVNTRSLSRSLGWLSLLAGMLWIPVTMVAQLLGPAQLMILLGLAVILSFVVHASIGFALLKHEPPRRSTRGRYTGKGRLGSGGSGSSRNSERPPMWSVGP